MALTKVNSTLVDGAINTASNGNVGIGTSDPLQKLDMNGTTARFSNGSYIGYLGAGSLLVSGGSTDFTLRSDNVLSFGTGGPYERMRITSSGYVGINNTSPVYSLDVRGSTLFAGSGSVANGQEFTYINGSDRYILTHGTSLNTATQMYFTNPNGTVGSISTSGSSTSYNTSSDYRLKDNVQPMVNALGKVAQLKPVTFVWNTDNKAGEGFLAHELQEVCPEAVYGEKDATEDYGDVLNEDGTIRYSDVRTPTTPEEGTTFVKKGERPVYQSVDTSFLVATLTAAIQEQQAIITDLKARIETLEAK